MEFLSSEFRNLVQRFEGLWSECIIVDVMESIIVAAVVHPHFPGLLVDVAKEEARMCKASSPGPVSTVSPCLRHTAVLWCLPLWF